jgi:hypothetical protein
MYPEEENAFYCQADETVYLFPAFMDAVEKEIGDYAPFTIIGHEWGHHVQFLANAPYNDSKSYELQADCLSGAFMDYVETRRLLDAGDFLEAIIMSGATGDDASAGAMGLPVDSDDAHGTSEERIKALVKGYGGGISRCGLSLGSAGGSTTPPVVTETSRGPSEPEHDDNLPAPRLPTLLPLAHASCFGIVDGGSLTFTELLDRFSGFPDAAGRLQSWGWQSSAYRQFGCDGPPEGDAGWIDVSVHGFSSAGSAQEAADYFAEARLDGSSLRRADGPGVGDYSVALIGPASNGTEFTLYATRGPWLVRVTGVSPSGIPFMNVRTVAIDVLEAQEIGGMSSAPPATDAPPSVPSLSSEAYLPSSPSLNYAACFRTHASGTYTRSDLASAFGRTRFGEGAVDTYGWQDGAYVVFRCDDPPFGHARQIEVLIHQFRDASSAQQIEGAVKAFHVPGDHESRACDTAGTLVICVSGYAETGSPLSDVYFVLNQVVTATR